jgi:transcriptional regulator with XRE-family HTH domain
MPDKNLLKAVGTKIKQIRAEKQMSQNKLADLCNFEKASMSRIESGQTNTTLLTLRKISAALDIHISELLKEA